MAMKTMLLIGIGPGDPKYLTREAIAAMNRADVFFLFGKKGRGKDELMRTRRAMLRRFVKGRKHRVVAALTPERDRAAGPNRYQRAVADWRGRKGDALAQLIGRELKDGETGALLVWGDPALYDGSIDMLEDLRRAGKLAFDLEVIPGISAVQALAARHKVALNRAGESVLITTGRNLRAMKRPPAPNIVVMLDQESALEGFPDRDAQLYWGAYLGMKDEVLLKGRLKDVLGKYARTRKARAKKKGWIMDTYLLRTAAKKQGRK
jgi:precorrin-6A synthase